MYSEAEPCVYTSSFYSGSNVVRQIEVLEGFSQQEGMGLNFNALSFLKGLIVFTPEITDEFDHSGFIAQINRLRQYRLDVAGLARSIKRIRREIIAKAQVDSGTLYLVCLQTGVKGQSSAFD